MYFSTLFGKIRLFLFNSTINRYITTDRATNQLKSIPYLTNTARNENRLETDE